MLIVERGSCPYLPDCLAKQFIISSSLHSDAAVTCDISWRWLGPVDVEGGLHSGAFLQSISKPLLRRTMSVFATMLCRSVLCSLLILNYCISESVDEVDGLEH